MAILKSQHNDYNGDLLVSFTNGLDIDARLYDQEIRVQAAWVDALNRAGILGRDDTHKLHETLRAAHKLMANGEFNWQIADEDIHMNLERYVTENLGDLGKRMHLGRSRNDLIATTLRLFVADSMSGIKKEVMQLIRALVTRAEMDIDVIVPGLTHLQHGQPVRYSHMLLAHARAFERDLKKADFAKSFAMDTMPLGSAALAGTTLDLDLDALAKDLGFASAPKNSYDAVGDRDFMLTALDVFSSVALHLSRLSEDLIYWSSTAVGLAKLPKNWSTGSSIMPNKRNPDVSELTRAKTAHIISASANGYMLVKAVHSSYGSDLHELKYTLMRSLDELDACLEIYPHLIIELEPNKERAAELCDKGHILATEIANKLTDNGVPFREAYAQVAALVKAANEQNAQITDLSPELIAELAPELDVDYVRGLAFDEVVDLRNAAGGTSRTQVEAAIKELNKVVS